MLGDYLVCLARVLGVCVFVCECVLCKNLTARHSFFRRRDNIAATHSRELPSSGGETELRDVVVDENTRQRNGARVSSGLSPTLAVLGLAVMLCTSRGDAQSASAVLQMSAALCVGGTARELVLLIADPSIDVCGDDVCSAMERASCSCRGTDCSRCCINGACELAFGESIDNCAADCPYATASMKPADGETSVSPLRVVEVLFARPIAMQVDLNSVLVVAAPGGTPLAGVVTMSPSGRSLVFRPSDAAGLPPSTTLVAQFDGSKVLDAATMKQIDADTDGKPGGLRTATFRTLPLAPLSNTGVWGIVRDRYE